MFDDPDLEVVPCVILCVILGVAGLVVYDDVRTMNAIVQMVKAGANPLEASCAVYKHPSVCIAAAHHKE